MTDIDEALDWQGNELRCADCSNHALSEAWRRQLEMEVPIMNKS